MIRRDFLRVSALTAFGVAVAGRLGWAARLATPAAPVAAPASRPWLVGSSRTGCARCLECAEIPNAWRRRSNGDVSV